MAASTHSVCALVGSVCVPINAGGGICTPKVGSSGSVCTFTRGSSGFNGSLMFNSELVVTTVLVVVDTIGRLKSTGRKRSVYASVVPGVFAGRGLSCCSTFSASTMSGLKS